MMIDVIKNKLIHAIVIALTLLSIGLIARPAYAAVDCAGLTGQDVTKCQACKGSGATSYSNGQCTDGSAKDPQGQVSDVVAKVVNIFSLVVGIAAVIMIMVGGFKYVTSQGDSGNVSGAKNTILYAIIGLVVVALAQTIVHFVINRI